MAMAMKNMSDFLSVLFDYFTKPLMVQQRNFIYQTNTCWNRVVMHEDEYSAE